MPGASAPLCRRQAGSGAMVAGKPIGARPDLDGAVWQQQVLLLDHASDHTGPARLVARADAGAIVAVEILVEEDQILPVRVFLKLRRAAVDRAAAVVAPHEDTDQAARDLM